MANTVHSRGESMWTYEEEFEEVQDLTVSGVSYSECEMRRQKPANLQDPRVFMPLPFHPEKPQFMRSKLQMLASGLIECP